MKCFYGLGLTVCCILHHSPLYGKRLLLHCREECKDSFQLDYRTLMRVCW